MVNKYEQALNFLDEYFIENPPIDDKIFVELLTRIVSIYSKNKKSKQLNLNFSPKEYELLLDFCLQNLSIEQQEELGYSEEDTKKDALWRMEYYGLPKNTTKGTNLNYNNYDFIFDDDGKYIGYVQNMERNGFISDNFDLEKLKIKLGI